MAQESGRTPIKVGSGYVEITPEINDAALQRFRKEILSAMKTAGTAAGRELGDDIAKGITGATREAQKSIRDITVAQQRLARETQRTAQEQIKAIRDVATTQLRVSRDVAQSSNRLEAQRLNAARQTETARIRAARDAEEARLRAEVATVRESTRLETARLNAATRTEQARTRLATQQEATRRALDVKTARQFTGLQNQMLAAARQAEAERLRVARERRAQERRDHEARVREIREELAAQRRAQQEALRDQVRMLQQQRSALLRQVRGYTDTQQTITQRLTSIADSAHKSWDKVGRTLDTFGTKVAELGRSINTNLVTPLATANTLAAGIGVRSADSYRTLELNLQGLGGVGASQREINRFVSTIQAYAVQTPYSLEMMQNLSPILARSIATNDPRYENPKTRQKAISDSLVRAANIIRFIGDNAAAAGITDSSYIEAAIKAVEQMVSRDKITAQFLNQLDRGSGLPVGTIAQLLGYDREDGRSPASRLYRDIIKKRNEGGVSGYQLADVLSTAYADDTLSSKGAAARITSETFTGRMQQLWERVNLGLGSLFRTRGSGGEESQLTPLGEKVHELITRLGEIAQALEDPAKESLHTFFDVLGWVAGRVQEAFGWLNEHPRVKELGEQILKWALVVGPLVLAFGVLLKGVGMLNRVLAGLTKTALKPAWAAGRAGTRVGRQFFAGTGNWAEGGTFREGYRQRRAELRGGDDRGPGRRLWDRITGRNPSQEGQNREAQRQLEEVERRIQDLRNEIQDLGRESLTRLARQMAGPGPESIRGAADDAADSVQRVMRDGIRPLQNARLDGTSRGMRDVSTAADALEDVTRRAKDQVQALTRLQFDALSNEVNQVKGAVDQTRKSFSGARGEVGKLNAAKLGSLRTGQVDTTDKRVRTLTSDVGKTTKAVQTLNGKSLKALRDQFSSLEPRVRTARDRIGQTTDRVNTLNRRSLSSIRDWFHGRKNSLYQAVTDVYNKIGTAKSPGTLSGRITNLNGRSLNNITKEVQQLRKELDGSEKEAKGLDSELGQIASKSRKRGGSTKPTKKATGGVIPGYAPGVDRVPAILSPGEAVLRPEVTRLLGEETINAWNWAARSGKIPRFAKGGIVGGLNDVRELIQLMDIAPMGSAAFKTMRLHSSADPIGETARGGIMSVGDQAAQYSGHESARSFKGMYDWLTGDLYSLLRKVPSGVGQVAGILAGALGPQLGDYFWTDVWKGHGNIVERGIRYAKHVFSVDNLLKAADNLWDGLMESGKGILSTVKDAVTDPFGFVQDAFGSIFGIFKDSYNRLINNVDLVRDISNSPMTYAKRVYDEFMSEAREAMPNTKGLFDFSEGAKLNMKTPDITSSFAFPDPKGDAVTRWKPLVQRVLKELGLPLSDTNLILHRIRVESGGNPRAINNWDINAKMGQHSRGLMQTIPSTFAAYAGKYRSRGIYDPLANIYAGVNYAIHRYPRTWRRVLAGTSGYWTGTHSASPGLALVGERGPELVDFRGGERVYNNGETRDLLGPRYEIHIHEAKSEDTTRSVIRAMQYAEAMYGPRL
ncbi:transglycosylase SLT domain-containing protein [Streptomyces sp. URMC 125]|uniref:transglycosylase SLT domain-containing protein n=1 Tax=Streptomyces sp. URMC 125 TaxID=3423419 RepID=UPI003F19E614